MPPRKTTARRPGQGQPKSTAAALKRSGQKKLPRNTLQSRTVAVGFGRGPKGGLLSTTAQGPTTRRGEQGKPQVGSSRPVDFDRGEQRPRLRQFDKVRQKGQTVSSARGVTTGDVLRSAARARTSAARAKTIAKWKGIQKERAASYKPKYRMGSTKRAR